MNRNNDDMKTYVITLSKVFPQIHPERGKETHFNTYFQNARMCVKCHETKHGMCMGECAIGGAKLHTIRANYGLWATRFEQIAAGEACLSVRQWSGAPYRSKQVEIARLTCKDGIGLQMLSFAPSYSLTTPFVGTRRLEREALAANDGLSTKDWENWFYHYDLTKPLAIIHFTKFRY